VRAARGHYIEDNGAASIAKLHKLRTLNL